MRVGKLVQGAGKKRERRPQGSGEFCVHGIGDVSW